MGQRICDLISEKRGQSPEYDPPRVIEVRDALPEDARAACEVMRQSISELCSVDHLNDPVILGRWLANKKRARRRVLWGVKPVRLASPAAREFRVEFKPE